MNRRKSSAVSNPIDKPKPVAPRWIVARRKEDEYWWLSESSEDLYWPEGGLGVLEAVQVQYLLEQLAQWDSEHLSAADLMVAFHFYTLQSEVADDQVRLAAVQGDVDLLDPSLFAMPVVREDGSGGYCEFLEKLTVARIRHLNDSHEYAEDCTELEMQEELDMLDRDRFFSVVGMHPFDEINEIITWSPAEWDET
jgi:hypothetical protein